MELLIFVIGASIGSFLNVLIDRLPNDETILGRSHCDHCGKKLSWFDLIPIVSFIFIKGKCRYCHKSLSFQYPFIEALTGISFVLVYLFQFSIIHLILMWGIASCLIVIFFTDLKYHLISDYMLVAIAVFIGLLHISSNLNLVNFLISGAFVALPIYLIYFISRERAMGLGDVHLSFTVGFLLGWRMGFMALYIAFVLGAVVGLIMIAIHKKKLKSRIPFGPFIVTGTVVMLFYGSLIMEFIGRIYGY